METLTATTSSVGHIATILSCVTNVSNKATVAIDQDGINFIAQDSHISKISLTLEKNLFTTYEFQGDTTTFNIDLKPIMESLTLNQTQNVECTIYYKTKGDPFILIFEDSKIIERCEFNTFIENMNMNITNFEINQIEMEGIIKSDILYDSLKDLKDLNTDEIYFYGDNQKKRPKFSIISKSEMGEIILNLPNERSILEDLKLINSNLDISSYNFPIFEKILRSLKISTKCKFQKDDYLLNLNLLIDKIDKIDEFLPNSYNGTIIQFQILQLVDKDEQIEDYKERFKLIPTIAPPLQHYNTNTDDPIESHQEITNDINIDVPIFL